MGTLISKIAYSATLGLSVLLYVLAERDLSKAKEAYRKANKARKK